MTLTKTTDGAALTIQIDGRLDTNTAPQLEAELSQSIDGMEKVCLDFSKLEYISSAGLSSMGSLLSATPTTQSRKFLK